MMKRNALKMTLLPLVAASILTFPPTVRATHYLSGTDVAAVAAGAAAASGLGFWINNFDSTRHSLLKGPLPGEMSLQAFLGGRCSLGRRNFLDNSFGSAVTPVTGAVLLTIADFSWPQEEAGRDVSQDLFLFTAGLVATKGVTDMAKGLTARPRPLLCIEPELADQRTDIDYAYDRQSFFSGHASSAFFTSTFLNKRFRSIMRQELSADEYRDWRWLPPTVLFGWATLVGWSRVHACKHFVSDVAAGALAGYLMAELFYSFGTSRDDNGDGTPAANMFLHVTFRF